MKKLNHRRTFLRYAFTTQVFMAIEVLCAATGFLFIAYFKDVYEPYFMSIYTVLYYNMIQINNDKIEYHLPNEFIDNLKAVSNKAPINNRTGHHTLIMFLTSSGHHLQYTANAYCSIKPHLSSNNFIFIALDDNSFHEMKNLGMPTIQYSRTVPRVDITVLRLLFAHKLLLLKTDVIQSDSDLVYFQNPLEIFKDNADWEVSMELPITKGLFTRNPGHSVNCGFWKMKASPTALIFMQRWIIACVYYKMPDQESIVEYLKKMEGNWTKRDQFKYYLKDDRINITFRFLDTLHVTLSNSVFCKPHREKFKREAKKRGITMPVVYHLAWYWPTRKPSALAEKNAWFTEFPKSKKCKKVVPNGTKMFWDNKYDAKTKIKKKLSLKDFPV